MPTAASMDAASVTAKVLLRPTDMRGAAGSKVSAPPAAGDPSRSRTASVTSCRAPARADAACADTEVGAEVGAA